MFALDIDLNVLLGVCVALGVLCLILLFVNARRKRDSLELQQDLNKNIEDFNRLLEKFDAVTAVKSIRTRGSESANHGGWATNSLKTNGMKKYSICKRN